MNDNIRKLLSESIQLGARRGVTAYFELFRLIGTIIKKATIQK